MGKCLHLGLGFGIATVLSAAPGAAPARKTSVVRPDPHTGRLVRSVVVSLRVAKAKSNSAEPGTKTAGPSPAAASATFNQAIVEQVADQNALPPQLLHSVIKVESNYQPLALSPKGAMGLMQLVPSTARRFGVADAFDPVDNLRGGARYLRYLLNIYGEENYTLALAAYNAGEGAVARYGGVPPYPETQNYVQRAVEDARRRGAAAAPPPPAASGNETGGVKPVEVQNHIYEVVEADGSVRYVSR